MIREVRAVKYRATCDNCGKTYPHDADSSEGALFVVMAHDWHSTLDGKLYCRECPAKATRKKK